MKFFPYWHKSFLTIYNQWTWKNVSILPIQFSFYYFRNFLTISTRRIVQLCPHLVVSLFRQQFTSMLITLHCSFIYLLCSYSSYIYSFSTYKIWWCISHANKNCWEKNNDWPGTASSSYIKLAKDLTRPWLSLPWSLLFKASPLGKILQGKTPQHMSCIILVVALSVLVCDDFLAKYFCIQGKPFIKNNFGWQALVLPSIFFVCPAYKCDLYESINEYLDKSRMSV